MVTVACVYWKGKFMGREDVFDSSWVGKLQNMVERNLDFPHKFVCLSNTNVPCERIPLENDWPGWWSKIELFRPGALEGKVLYLDLDLVIVRSLQPFLVYANRFGILRSHDQGEEYEENGKIVVPKYNSSVMSFNARDTLDLYNYFTEDVMDELRSDQDYIARMRPNLAVFPQGWVEKLRHLPNGRPTEDTKVVLCMHQHRQKNISAAKKYNWINELWR